MLRSFLLAPCLLISLACATPFPVEDLEVGMTAETVRENFGEPVATNTVWDPPGKGSSLRGNWTYNAESSLTYVDEEQNWLMSITMSSLFLPLQIVVSVIEAISYRDDDFRWDWAYVERKPVVLYFEQEELVSSEREERVFFEQEERVSFEHEGLVRKLLSFEQEKLVRWKVIEPTYVTYPVHDFFMCIGPGSRLPHDPFCRVS